MFQHDLKCATTLNKILHHDKCITETFQNGRFFEQNWKLKNQYFWHALKEVISVITITIQTKDVTTLRIFVDVVCTCMYVSYWSWMCNYSTNILMDQKSHIASSKNCNLLQAKNQAENMAIWSCFEKSQFRYHNRSSNEGCCTFEKFSQK